jgi:hypothetical protein
MNRKILATLIVLASATAAFAQTDDTTTALQSFIGLIGPIAAFIWLILFAAWGGFRYIL